MMTRLIEFIKKVVGRIMPDKNVEERLGISIEISDEMARNIDLWTKMYEDKATWVDNEEVRSYSLSASIASEIARLTTIEMESEITGLDGKDNERSTYLNEQYQRVVDSLRIQTEYAVAKGGIIFKPYVDDGKIAVDYVQTDSFYPVEFDSTGKLIGVIFPETIIRNGKTFTRLEYHQMLGNGLCYIKNTAYMKDGEDQSSTDLGVEVPLTRISEWETLEPEINLKGLEQPLFSYFKMPLANNIDSRSNIGVSIYSKSVGLIEQVDRQYSRILWEFEGTELALNVGMDMVSDSIELPKGKKRLYVKLDTEKDLYEVFNPDIRDSSLYNGMNKLIQRIEFNCGLAYGTLSDMQMVEKTATEINASKQRSYSTIVDIQKSLRIALEHLILSMNYLTDFYELAKKGEIETSFTFDDSIIVNAKEEQAIMLTEVSAGLIKKEKYLMARYGVSEEIAKGMLPDMDTGIKDEEFDNLE